MEREEIKQYLPHREPMLLVDDMEMEGDVGETADVAFSTQIAVVFFRFCALRTGYSDPYGAFRIAPFVAPFRESGGGDGIVRFHQFPDAFSHGAGNLTADQTMVADGFCRDAEDLFFDPGGVRGDGSDIPGGGAGDGGEQVGDLSAGAGLGGAEGAPAILEQPGYLVLNCFVHF